MIVGYKKRQVLAGCGHLLGLICSQDGYANSVCGTTEAVPYIGWCVIVRLVRTIAFVRLLALQFFDEVDEAVYIYKVLVH